MANTRKGLLNNEEEGSTGNISSIRISSPNSSHCLKMKTPLHLHRDLSETTPLYKCEKTAYIQRNRASNSIIRTGLIGLVTSFCTLASIPACTDAMVLTNNNNSNSIQRHAAATSSNLDSSSNALALLNTVRLLREQKSSTSSSSSSSERIITKSKKTQKVQEFAMQKNYQVAPSFSDLNRLHDPNSSSWTSALFDDEDLNAIENNKLSLALLNREEELISDRVHKQLPSVKSLLRTSAGNDVPDMELHLQMEAARVRGKVGGSVAALTFMELHHGVNHKSKIGGRSRDVSTVEKVAMSSLPSQLPVLAAPVLAVRDKVSSNASTRFKTGGSKIRTMKESNGGSGKNDHGKSRKQLKKDDGYCDENIQNGGAKKIMNASNIKRIRTKKVSTIMSTRKALSSQKQKKSPSHVPSTTERVSHEEELQLARIIQRGAALHGLKSKFEQENMRDITRQEWTELAELDSPKELRRLVSNYRKAKNKLVMANMGLVHAVVRSRMGVSGVAGSTTYGGISYEEMVQEGSLGLLRAAELFDPSRGLRFSTYATIWIKGILSNSSVSEAITLPLREKNKWKKIQKSIEEIRAEKGADDSNARSKPTDEEIASQCGLKPDEVKTVMRKMKRTKNVLSLDYQYDSQSRSGVEGGKFDALANDKNLMDDVDLVERLQLRADVVAALTKNLDPREARLMRLRYGLNDGKTRSIADCGEAMGISRQRAQQLAAGCLKKLREADDAESLQEYLLSVA